MSGKQFRVGFDIGGTFTDFALHEANSRTLEIYKTLTTPDDPSRGAVSGMEALLANAGITFGDVGEVVHGTTLVTNALIEGKGCRTALLTTRGFRDVLELGFEQRYDIYDLFLTYPKPLVPRRFRREIDERISGAGRVLTALDKDMVCREAEALLKQGIEAIAVCYLHSYNNPEHELETGRLLTETFPELAVSLSCEVAPEVREYERVCTTTANAFVQPLMNRYLRSMQDKFAERGFTGRLSLMLSSGGLATPEVARRFPIRLLESGPAGGALATALVGRKLERPDLIAFDMGGTTAKAALIQNGGITVAPMMEVARVDRFKKGSGIPVRSPVVEMIEIGAGGGSIARLDEVGLIKVGPESASASPGPACYGLGGTLPTVTDANLALGYLNPGFFCGGRIELKLDAAQTALATLGAPLDLDAAQTAWGVYTIVCENMAAAARAHIVEKGRDPRGFAMAAFGGAGPAHAAKVARIIGVKEVLIPPASGAASAVGFLVAPPGFETVRSSVVTLDAATDVEALNTLLDEIERDARDNLRDANIVPGTETVTRSADMRLRGQLREIAVPLPAGRIDPAALDEIRASFREVYEALYRAVPPGAIIEALSWRVRVAGPAPDIALHPRHDMQPADSASKGTRRAWFGEAFVNASIYDRYSLRHGDTVAGPAIIEEVESTTVIPPGDTVTVDGQMNLRIAIGSTMRQNVDEGELNTSLAAVTARIQNDPIGLEIMWGRLVNITDECWDAVCRTAFSLIISDAQDFSLGLFDSNGQILVSSPRAQPVFNMCLPKAIEAVLERFPLDQLQPGDVLITNDPWLAAGHLFDVALVTPVFHEGKVVGHIGAVGHVTDIGGTRNLEQAHEIYEEGFQIPPMRFYRGGEQNEDLVALLRENVRDQRQVLGDLHALVGASAIGAQRLAEFLTEYRMRDLTALSAIFQDRSEAAMREAIRAIPDGVYESEIAGQLSSEMQSLPVKVIVQDDAITVDLTGAPKQASRGGVNCTLNYTAAHSVYPFKCLLTPSVRGNSGDYKPFTLKVPEGSILNANKPASVSRRQTTGWFLGPNTFAALAKAIPGNVRAFTGFPWAAPFYGSNREGEPFITHIFAGGGEGGSALNDGKSGLLYPIGSSNTSTELFEIRTDMLVEEKQLARDSGGAGRHRGGLGQRVKIVKLLGSEFPAQCVLNQYGQGVRVGSLLGGKPGSAIHANLYERADAAPRALTGAGLTALQDSGSAVEVFVAGGHGYGDPLEREIALIEADIENDYVSLEQAEQDYGCVFDRAGRIDRDATARKRAVLAGARQSEPLDAHAR
ncbi:methylhydantoinase [Burkholderia cenocepacia]|nr:methylhydantoinase [Burkholderia cenocepacia]